MSAGLTPPDQLVLGLSWGIRGLGRGSIRHPPYVAHAPAEVEGVEVLAMVSVVLGSGLGPAGRIPLDVTAAGIAVVTEGLSEFGRFLRWRISLKPSGVTGVTVPPLIAPPPDPGGLEDGLVVRLSGYHAFADMIPGYELDLDVAVGIDVPGVDQVGYEEGFLFVGHGAASSRFSACFSGLAGSVPTTSIM